METILTHLKLCHPIRLKDESNKLGSLNPVLFLLSLTMS